MHAHRLPAFVLFFPLTLGGIVPSLLAEEKIRNGDIDGNGSRDITDVIKLADFLFRGASPPVPFVCPDPGGEEEGTPVFTGDLYLSLDLERAAVEQHGPRAVLVSTGDHLYDWKVKLGNELRGLDLVRAVADQYGSGYRLVTTGVHKFDWKAFRFSEPDHVVLPVMIVAADRFFDIEGVRRAVDRYRSVLGRVQTWYNAKVGAELRMLQPLVIGSGLTSAEWNAISNSTQDNAHRYDLLSRSIETHEGSLPAPGGNLRVVIAQYTGDSAGVWLGAAASGRYAVATPRSTSLDCPETGDLDSACSDAAYAIGHELGHTFGLGHSCDDYPNHPHCSRSIMQVGKPPAAILLPDEACRLLGSPFFHPLAAGGGAAFEIVPRPADAD